MGTLNKYDPQRKQRFVEHLFLGMHPLNAARAAGLGASKGTVASLMRDDYVRDLLAAYREELSRRLRVDRERVTEMVMDAFDAAKVQADAKGMVAATQELSKLFGLYAPDEVTITHRSKRAEELERELSTMPTEKLLEYASGDEVIEGEFVVLEDARE